MNDELKDDELPVLYATAIQEGEAAAVADQDAWTLPIPPSTPIGEAVITLMLTTKLPSHVRTAGDLLVAAERGEVKVSKAQREKIG